MRFALSLLFLTLAIAAQSQSLDSLLAFSPDSLVLPYQQKLDSLQRVFYSQSDSLKTSFKQKLSALDSSRAKVQSKIDSLQVLQLPTEKYTHKLDSIKEQQATTVASLNQKMEDLKSKTTGRLKELKLPPELTEKVGAVANNIEDFQLPVKDLNIPSLNLPDSPLQNLDGLNSTFKSPLGSIGEIDGLQNLRGNLSGVSKITDQLGGYKEDLQSITQGDLGQVKELPQALEQKAADLTGLKQITEQTKALDPLLEAGKSPEALKEQAMEQAREAAVNHFAGKEKELQQAMESISKLKKKYLSLNSLSEIPTKRPNEMRGKALIERLVPGIAIQLQKKNSDLFTDFNPYLGYRFTTRLTVGAGWNQRVTYDLDQYAIDPGFTRIYGPRVYSEYKLGKGFSPRVEVEAMNTFVPPYIKTVPNDPGSRQWVWGVFAGLKKDYKFFKKLNGTTLVMFRLFDPERKSPYADVLNVRFGFELPMKKKVKSD